VNVSILMPALLPSAFAGVVFGSALVCVGWKRKQRGTPHSRDTLITTTSQIRPGSRLERIPVFLCGVVALVGTVTQVGVAAGRRDFHPLILLMLVLMLLLGSPSILWRSSWRETAIGAGTIGVSVFAFMAGFSIGVFFVPLVVAMVLVCFSRLRGRTPVDSPV